MTAWQALGDFFKKYAVFRGTSSRSAFNWITWFWSIVYFILAATIIVIALLGANFGSKSAEPMNMSSVLGTLSVVIIVSFLLAIIMIVPNMALYARRLHDAGFSGWWQAIPVLIAVVALIIEVIFHPTGIFLLTLQIGPMIVSLFFTIWLSLVDNKIKKLI